MRTTPFKGSKTHYFPTESNPFYSRKTKKKTRFDPVQNCCQLIWALRNRKAGRKVAICWKGGVVYVLDLFRKRETQHEKAMNSTAACGLQQQQYAKILIPCMGIADALKDRFSRS